MLTARDSPAVDERGLAPLLEREPFLAELRALLDAAATGSGRLALIGGEAGIGKTALVETFCAASAGAAHVLSGACDALTTPRPLGPLIDIARQAGGALHGVLAGSAPRESMFDALLGELGQAGRPVVLAIEDIHWADEATFDLIRFLARRLASLRALVIATYRDDEIGPRHPVRLLLGDLATSRAVRRLTLPPLSERAVSHLAGASALDVAALHRQTCGNPFFVTEILASGGIGLPASVRDAVLARIARLGTRAHDAIEMAAVIGFRCSADLLASLLGPDAAAIDDCASAGVLREEPGAFAFRHEITRQAVLDAISPHRRRALHRQVLDTLRGTATDPDALARLAHHAEMAGDREAVLDFAPAAARRAIELKANREAAAQYARALRWASDCAAPDRAALLDSLAYQCYLTDRHVEAVEAWTAALAIWRQLGNPRKEADTLRLLSRPLWHLGRNPEAEERLRDALLVLETLPPGLELGWVFSDLSRLKMTAGQSEAAIAWGERALPIAERFDDAGLLAHALNNLGAAKLELGDEDGRALLLRSLAVARAANLEEHAGRAYINLSCRALEAFQLAEAERWIDEGIGYTLDHDVETYRLCLESHRPYQLFHQSRWSEAADAAVALLQRPDLSPLYRLGTLIMLGRTRARRGDPEADAALADALALATSPLDLASVHVARLEAALLAGNRQRGETELRAASAAAVGLKDSWLAGELAHLQRLLEPNAEPSLNISVPYARQMAGDWAGAAANWTALGCPYEAARALAGSDDDAALRRALTEFDRLGARPMAAIVTRRLRELGARGVARGPRAATRANPAALTAREMEIWGLLAEGLRNAEIADRLSISAKTVEHHVSAILAKLGARSRVEAANAFAEHAPDA